MNLKELNSKKDVTFEGAPTGPPHRWAWLGRKVGLGGGPLTDSVIDGLIGFSIRKKNRVNIHKTHIYLEPKRPLFLLEKALFWRVEAQK